MSVAIWPRFDPAEPAIEPHLDGKALCAAVPELDALVRRLGIRTVTSFMDNRPLPPEGDISEMPDPARMPEAFITWATALEEAIDNEEVTDPWKEWFSAAEGLRTFAALEGVLRLHEDRSGVLSDVEELKRCLILADRVGVRFRLEVY